jgi:hypothetical protein
MTIKSKCMKEVTELMDLICASLLVKPCTNPT